MQHPPPLLEQAAVGHLVGEGVLEGILALREEARLVEELGRLQMRKARRQPSSGTSAMACRSGQGHLGADDRRGLEQALLLRRQPVDARRQHRLHRGRHLNARQGLRQAIGARRADQHPGLHQGAHALLQEEGVALGARDQERCERCQTGVIPQQRLQQFLGTRRRQRVEPELGVVGLAPPAMLILRAVVDQQQQPGRGQALDQAVEQGLGLGIDPVQVLEDQQQRLHLAFTEEQALDGLQGVAATLRGIERLPRPRPPPARRAAPGSRAALAPGRDPG